MEGADGPDPGDPLPVVWDEARELVTATPRAASANYLVGDRRDLIYSLETSPDRVTPLTWSSAVPRTSSSSETWSTLGFVTRVPGLVLSTLKVTLLRASNPCRWIR